MAEDQKPITSPSWDGLALRWLGWAAATIIGWLGAVGFGLSAMPNAETAIYAMTARQRLNVPPEQAVMQALQGSLTSGLKVGLVVGVALALFQRPWEKGRLLRALPVVATTLVMSSIFFVAANPAPPEATGDLMNALSYYLAAGFAGGLIAAVGQYLLLRRWVSGYWVPITTLTWAIAFAASIPPPAIFAEIDIEARRAVMILLPLGCGALIGLAQWLLLRRAFRNAGWWIAAWAAGWALTGQLGIPGIVALGVITASVLVMLMQWPRAATAGSPS